MSYYLSQTFQVAAAENICEVKDVVSTIETGRFVNIPSKAHEIGTEIEQFYHFFVWFRFFQH